MTLGERIKQVRNFLGYTQQDLADLTGISRISISNYERNCNSFKYYYGLSLREKSPF